MLYDSLIDGVLHRSRAWSLDVVTAIWTPEGEAEAIGSLCITIGEHYAQQSDIWTRIYPPDGAIGPNGHLLFPLGGTSVQGRSDRTYEGI